MFCSSIIQLSCKCRINTNILDTEPPYKHCLAEEILSNRSDTKEAFWSSADDKCKIHVSTKSEWTDLNPSKAVMLEDMLCEVWKSRLCTIMANEVTSNNKWVDCEGHLWVSHTMQNVADIPVQEYDCTVSVSISGATAMVTTLQSQSCLCMPKLLGN